MSGVGAHLLELKSDQLGLRLLEKENPFYVRTVALVSNMAIHIKSTETELLVWVTNLSSTTPVEAVDLELLSCSGESFGRTKTNQKGLANLKPLKKLDYNNLKYCAEGGKFSSGFIVIARKGNDIALASSTWDEGISRWRFGVPMPYGEKEFAVHAVLDRNLIRPNETLHMKVFSRVLSGRGLRFAKVDELPKEMLIEHYFSGEQIKSPIKWNVQTGSFTSELLITEKMKLGRWNISLKGKKESYLAGSFDVQQYQIPMVEVKILASTDPLIAVTKIPYQVNAQYLSGGAADSLYMTETWSVSDYSRGFVQKDRESFSVLNGKVEEGIKKNNYDYGEGDAEVDTQGQLKFKQNVKKFALNKTGGVSNVIEGVPVRSEPQVVNLNLQYRDPNGELQTKGRSFVVYGADKLLGLKIERDGNTNRPFVAKALVTDLTEKAFDGASVKFNVFEKLMFSHRKRLVGGFYSYESFVEVKKTNFSCESKTDSKGLASCKLKVERPGHYYVQAETEDARGNKVFANTYAYFGERTEGYWDDSEDSDRMTLSLNKERYAPEEVARIEAKVPFAKGHYLVTVEREGVMQAEVYELKQAAPEILLPIKKEFSPNVFVSVFAIRGRASDYKPTALIDLGKPTYRMGVAEVKVAMTHNRLNVKVQTDAKTYRVRDVAKAKVSVTDHQNKPVKGQVILAAVDEGLLYLAPNTTWNLVENMIRVRGLSVDTATSLTEVVGRRHYGKKAIANGGDGRGSQLREQMDSLLLWKSEVNLDEKGEAIVDVPLNDSLSAFRIVAIATNSADQFGTGSTSIRTTQDVMIFSGLPTFTRQGDSLMANVTVRNSSNRQIEGQMLASWNGVPLEVKKTQLAAERSSVFEWKVSASEIGNAKFIAEFKSASGKREDGLAKEVAVLNPSPLRTQANVLYKLDSLRTWPLPWRPDLKVDSGVVDVKLSSDLNLDKAQMKEFWDDYPYSCLEQQISRAASLNDSKLWSKINRNLSVYVAKSGLFKFFPESESSSGGSVALTSYYVLMAKARNFEVAQEDKLKETLRAYIQGRIIETYKLDEATKLQMKITAAEALVKLGALQMNERVQYMPELNKLSLSSLFSLREIHIAVPSSVTYLGLIDQQIKSRMTSSGSEAGFNEDFNSWLTLSNSQVQLARAILWPALGIDDLGRLLTATQKRVGNYMWQSTIGNAWMSVALGQAQEKLSSKVDGSTEVSLGTDRTTKKWSAKELEINALRVPLNAGLMQIYHRGSGAPWMTAQFKARKDLQSEVNQGLQFLPISKSLKEKTFATNTDDESVLEFTLNSAQDLNWVAVEIPMPPGAMLVDLESSAWIEFQERRYESLKLYLSYLAKGETKFKVVVRTNQKGQFQVPGLRAEAMYSPQYQSETSAIKWSVQ